MAGLLDGKNIAITGAGNGIGKATALAAAAEGANIVVADYGVSMDGSDPSSEVADATVAEIEAAGGQAIAVAGNVADGAVGQQIVDAACDTWGTIDGVICVAGNLRERMLFNMSEEEWDAVIAVHLKGHFNVFRPAFAKMRKQDNGGSLLGFTSGAFMGSTAQANYASAKGGIISLMRSAALTGASISMRGGPVVRANCIAPIARTRMSENVPFDFEMGTAEDIAPMALFLMSDASREVTGQTYTVVAGRISVWSQPEELRSIQAPGEQWTPQQIADNFADLGIEKLPFIADLEQRMADMAREEAEKAEG